MKIKNLSNQNQSSIYKISNYATKFTVRKTLACLGSNLTKANQN